MSCFTSIATTTAAEIVILKFNSYQQRSQGEWPWATTGMDTGAKAQAGTKGQKCVKCVMLYP